MKAPQYSMEMGFKIYDEESGLFIDVRPDPDGLGCVYVDDGDSHHSNRFFMPPAQALLVAEAIKRVALDMIERDEQS